MGMFSAIRTALRTLAGRGEVADAPPPVKSCPMNAAPHRCNEREFHPEDPLAAMEQQFKTRRFR